MRSGLSHSASPRRISVEVLRKSSFAMQLGAQTLRPDVTGGFDFTARETPDVLTPHSLCPTNLHPARGLRRRAGRDRATVHLWCVAARRGDPGHPITPSQCVGYGPRPAGHQVRLRPHRARSFSVHRRTHCSPRGRRRVLEVRKTTSELVAWIRSVLRRIRPASTQAPSRSDSDLKLNCKSLTSNDAIPGPTSQRPSSTLSPCCPATPVASSPANSYCSWCGELLAQAHTNVLNAQICALRRKLASIGAPDAIRTTRGLGFILSSSTMDAPGRTPPPEATDAGNRRRATPHASSHGQRPRPSVTLVQ